MEAERSGVAHELDRLVAPDAELAFAGDLAFQAAGGQADIDGGAWGVGGQLVQLGDAVEGEAPQAGPGRLPDVGPGLDGAAEDDLLGPHAKAGQGLQLGVGGDLKAAAGGVKATKDPCIRVALGRIADGDIGQGVGDGVVGALDRLQVHQQIGRGMVELAELGRRQPGSHALW